MDGANKARPPAGKFCALTVSSLTQQRRPHPPQVGGLARPGSSGKRICPWPDPRGLRLRARPATRPGRSIHPRLSPYHPPPIPFPSALLLKGFPPGELAARRGAFCVGSRGGSRAVGRWSALGPALRPAEGLGAHCRPWALAPQTPGPRPARIPRGARGTSIPLAPAQWQQAPAALLTSAGPGPAHLGGASTPPNPTLPALPGVLTVPGPGRRSAHHALAPASSSLPLHSSTLGPAPALERRPPVLTYSLQWQRLAGWSGPPTEVTAAGTRGGCGAG